MDLDSHSPWFPGRSKRGEQSSPYVALLDHIMLCQIKLFSEQFNMEITLSLYIFVISIFAVLLLFLSHC